MTEKTLEQPSRDAPPPVQSYRLATQERGCMVTLESRMQREGLELWAVLSEGQCLTGPGEWEFEPRPSSRDDAYLARSRRDLPDAFDLWRRHLETVSAGLVTDGRARDLVPGRDVGLFGQVHDPDGVLSRMAPETT